MVPDDSFLRDEVKEPSLAAEARVTEAIRSGVLDVVGIEGHLFGLELSSDKDVPLKMRTQTNIEKRESGLKDPRVALRIARLIQLLRDRKLMDSLSLSDLLDQSVVNSIQISFHVPSWFAA